MKKKCLGIPLYWFLIVFAVAIVGIIFGSFFDKDLSKAIASSSNGFGKFIETFGESLAYSTGTIGGLLAWLGLWKRKPIWQKIIGWVILIATTAVLTKILGESFWAKGEGELIAYGFRIQNQIVSYLVAFLILAGIDVAVFFLVDRSEANFNRLLRIGIVLVAAILIQWLLMHVLKRIGGRPRWRFLAELGGVWEGTNYDFQNWWNFAWFKNPSIDYFKSWPSGHTATAATVTLFGLLPLVMKKDLPHAQLIGFWGGFAYTVIVAFARILAGAHFLSDVSFGLLVGALSGFLPTFAADKILPEKKEEEPAPVE